jgi:hypothetical protein
VRWYHTTNPFSSTSVTAAARAPPPSFQVRARWYHHRLPVSSSSAATTAPAPPSPRTIYIQARA